jgi:hypothetical protein
MTQQTDAVTTDTDSTDTKLYSKETQKVNGRYCDYYQTDEHMITTKHGSDEYCVRLHYNTDSPTVVIWCTAITSDNCGFNLKDDIYRMCKVEKLNISDAFTSLLSDIESGDI